MIKKVLLGVGGLSLLALLFFGGEALSYMSTAASRVKQTVKDSVPIDFEINRARDEVKKLVPDIRRNMHVIAQEEVEVERLKQQISEADKSQAQGREELMRLKNDAGSGRSTFDYAGRTYTIVQVKLDLANRFDRYKTNDATLASFKDILQARTKSLDAARQKLDAMLAAKRKLEVDVENLEARLKMVEVAQTTSEYSFDDSRLGHAKQLISDLRTRLSVAEKLVNAESDMRGEIPVSQPAAAENIVEQVTEYFTPGTAQVAEAKK